VIDVVLKVDDLRKTYGSVKAVDGVSFEVSKGQIFTLLGPNGAGKTTTMEIVEGIRKGSQGKIEYFGKAMQTVDTETKERIGVCLQSTSFMPHLRVRETLSMFSSFYKKRYPIEDLIRFVSLEEKSKASVDKLSGGQKQRVAIACALVNDPDIVFLDEPTTGLDPQARRNVWELIEMLKKKGKTVFLTTHYMEEAQVLSDMVCIMDHGKIIASGTPLQLINQLGELSFIEFSGEVQEDDLELFRAWDVDEVYSEAGIIHISTRSLSLTLDALLNWARLKEHNLSDINIRQPNLEDVFLSLTGRRLRE